jgi:hypothetical protein
VQRLTRLALLALSVVATTFAGVTPARADEPDVQLPREGVHAALDVGLFYGRTGGGECTLTGTCAGQEYGALTPGLSTTIPVGDWLFDGTWRAVIAADERPSGRLAEGFLSSNVYLGTRHWLQPAWWIGGGLGLPLAPSSPPASRALALAAYVHGLEDVWLFLPSASLVARGGLRVRAHDVVFDVPASLALLIGVSGSLEVPIAALQLTPRATLLLVDDVIRFDLHSTLVALVGSDSMAQVSFGTRAAVYTSSFFTELRFDLHAIDPGGAAVDWFFQLSIGADLTRSPAVAAAVDPQ